LKTAVYLYIWNVKGYFQSCISAVSMVLSVRKSDVMRVVRLVAAGFWRHRELDWGWELNLIDCMDIEDIEKYLTCQVQDGVHSMLGSGRCGVMALSQHSTQGH
jgi:hypothetical protein